MLVTGESPPSLSKELTSSLAGVGDVSFDADSQFPLDELKIDPLTLDGLHMLNDPDIVLADPATEDTFRMDRLWSKQQLELKRSSLKRKRLETTYCAAAWPPGLSSSPQPSLPPPNGIYNSMLPKPSGEGRRSSTVVDVALLHPHWLVFCKAASFKPRPL